MHNLLSSPKSAIYYKGDLRVKKWASNLFLLAGILGAPNPHVVLSKVLFLRSCHVLQFFDLVEEEVDIFLILPPIEVVSSVGLLVASDTLLLEEF